MENLEELFTQSQIRLGEPTIVPIVPPASKAAEKAVDIFDYTWKPMHEMLEHILKVSDSEMQVQQTLHDLQSLVNMAGSIKLPLALHSVLGTLCAWSLPQDLGRTSLMK